MDYKKTAAEILRLVGGEKNVASVTNCMTRLRFNLNDAKKADVEAIKKNERRSGGSNQKRPISSCHRHRCG